MFKIDENYSDYYMNDPVKYPGGGAVNSSGPDAIDGTPWLAKFFNNCVGWMQALYIKAFRSLDGISNDAENVQTSDVVRALEKIQTDNNTAQRTISDEKYLPMEGSAASAKKLTTARKVYVKLGTASTSETKDFSGDTAIPVDGALNVANGGTGSSTAAGARTNLGLGSAAVKDAGSAAGNVPEVGTALGTTNNNILVTDASGKLKPSGTVIGSAAGKTAGSVAGNVPEVGTALGTTNNNIVVTDANGKLKPSGTTIGSAAGKTAGSAAGNVPEVGTALGTTNNNILVTDASGKMKPSGTVIGSAAGKTAGSAAGNVPLVGTALGTTDNNLLVTNASGGMKPFGKTPNQIAYWGNGGGVCATAAATGAKTVSISGFNLYTGVTVKVMFTNGNSNNAPTLNVNSTGAKNIKVVKAGAKITPPVHTGKWRGASSATTEAWQPLTTLELMYDGTDWVIIGNPIVEDYYSESQSYIVYANGFIDIMGYEEITQNNAGELKSIIFPITFTQTTPMCTTGLARQNTDGLPAGAVSIQQINESGLSFGFVISANYVKGSKFNYNVRGY